MPPIDPKRWPALALRLARTSQEWNTARKWFVVKYPHVPNSRGTEPFFDESLLALANRELDEYVAEQTREVAAAHFSAGHEAGYWSASEGEPPMLLEEWQQTEASLRLQLEQAQARIVELEAMRNG